MPIYYQIKSFIKHYLSIVLLDESSKILLNTDLTLMTAMVTKMAENIGHKCYFELNSGCLTCMLT